jgi:hypothetical protein
MSEHTAEPTDLQTVYRRGNVIYVPHYDGRQVFVGPGYGRANTREYTAAHLYDSGAYPAQRPLWRRPGRDV